MKAQVGDKVVVNLKKSGLQTLTVTDTPESRTSENAIWYHPDEYRGVAVPEMPYNGWYFKGDEIVSIERYFSSGHDAVTITITAEQVVIRHQKHNCCGGHIDTIMEIPREVLVV